MLRRKTPSRGGCPPKITFRTALELGLALGRGKSVERAAKAPGVGTSSAHRWTARGRSGDPRFSALDEVADRSKEWPFGDMLGWESLGLWFSDVGDQPNR
jgi:hypothetical protein